MGEKRRFMRFNVFMDALCCRNGMSKKVKVNNFSREGIGILSREAFSEGENLEIELMIPGDNIPVLLEGEIAWMNGPTSDNAQRKGGVRFKKIANGDRGRVLEYIYQNWIKPASAEVK
jgi:hypothetical protein